MTERDVQNEQDVALGRYMRLKQTHAAAVERLAKAGREMGEIGSELRAGGRKLLVGFEAPAWLNADEIRKMLADAATAATEMNQARDKAIALGVAIARD